MAARRVAWVTGAAGFIGGHVSARLAREGWSVLGLDRAPAATPNHIAGALSSATLDRAFQASGPPDLVFHGAGTGSVGESARDLAASQRDLVAATETLLAALLSGAPSARMIFPSSAAVYGDAGGAALSEDAAIAPISSYGRHKFEAEQACKAAAAKGLPVAIVRLFSVYGPGLRKQLPWDLGRRLLAGESPVTLFGTGAETRDFLEISDVADLVAFLADAPYTAPLVINGGTGAATRIADFAAALRDALAVKVPVTFTGETRAGDPQHYRADTRRLEALGFTPKVDLRAGLNRYAAWLKTGG